MYPILRNKAETRLDKLNARLYELNHQSHLTEEEEKERKSIRTMLPKVRRAVQRGREFA